MIRSMTGYGRGEAEYEGRRFVVEARSVNHRYCDVALRVPKRYAMLEAEIKKTALSRVSRGKLDISLAVEGMEAVPAFELNAPLAEGYHQVLSRLKERLGLGGEITVRDIISIPDVISFSEKAPDMEKEWPYIEDALRNSLDSMDGMKRAEGDMLAAEGTRRLQKISEAVNDIETRAPEVVGLYKKRLTERIEGMGYELDQGRLAQEVAFFADKCDISEELVRLRSHIEQFKGIADAPEPSGRKLDFLVQEINREINTVGSKGNDAVISLRVVDVKAELEKIREQLQNIE